MRGLRGGGEGRHDACDVDGRGVAGGCDVAGRHANARGVAGRHANDCDVDDGGVARCQRSGLFILCLGMTSLVAKYN